MDNSLKDTYNSAYSAGKQTIGEGIGNFFTGNTNWKRQAIMQDRQNAYQTHMSNTAYQRATKDLQKAGLNPALLAGGNKPASSPSTTGNNSALSSAEGSQMIIKGMSALLLSMLKK